MSARSHAWFTFEGTSFDVRSFSRLWLAAVATYGVGDIVTTIAVIYFVPWTVEANPVVRAAIEAFGGGGFLGLKLLVFYVCIGISLWGAVRNDDPVLYYAPPLILTVLGAFVTVANLNLLF